jgi:hypothetical protein
MGGRRVYQYTNYQEKMSTRFTISNNSGCWPAARFLTLGAPLSILRYFSLDNPKELSQFYFKLVLKLPGLLCCHCEPAPSRGDESPFGKGCGNLVLGVKKGNSCPIKLRELEAVKMGENRYWNPLLETLPRDELLQIEIDKFRTVMAFAIENSPIMAFIDILIV